ncbi:MAG: polysaccharide deacetylase family protein [Oscillospiraceae bacterium]|nr:polysaccharide deacetylase family protein [Oscillospiraceae bacterium]
MILYDLARRAKHILKEYQKSRDCEYITPVRRIERVFPLTDRRVCAMTFDDGPTDTETNPKISDDGLTLHLLKTLEKFGAKGTFDVIGTTEHNYPDEAGVHGSFSWGGVRYDHYPDINRDLCAGAKNKSDLISRILSGGHEITNHGYRHILFGHLKLVYGARACFNNIHEVISDIMELDSLLLEEHGYKMRLSRPPHYVDKIPDGKTSYDAYRYAGYNYLAASFDGGGWLPSTGDFKKDIDAMVEPISRALSEDPDSLNGQIIFQKDGYSMSRHTPVAEALPLQLDLLKKHGYDVISVSELLSLSQFADCVNEDAQALANAGFTVAYKNNTLHPERAMTFGELVVTCTPPQDILTSYRKFVDSGFETGALLAECAKRYGVGENHPYFIAFCKAAELGIINCDNSEKLSYKTTVTGELLSAFLRSLAPTYSFTINPGKLSRRDVFPHLRAVLVK